ncbi:MAG: peptidase C14 caspase catalytic subunit p20 [Ancylobacter novellus]|uniref:Peptidase C14 caspase catalytic subunit p20 n=1 Tax=Ancylobacter novellus TaxID=921 RepID=A0A2W5MHI0_ANCNO|nr:MAG: peptidase C14 caspase catalytic subunit p20 [Ancylobacter novellus]
MKRALVIGINDYARTPLSGCVNDARAVAQLLERNGDGSPNFEVRTLVSPGDDARAGALSEAIAELFSGEAETALLYFAGHGLLSPDTNTGYLCASDVERGRWGVSLEELLGLANAAHPKIRSSVIVLDSCHSGYAGESAALNAKNTAVIGVGVTILAASHRDQTAGETAGHGVFTGIFLDGLSGACSDICGNVTPAALYSHVDQTLGPWKQRPIYKANVQHFVSLRNVAPKVALETLRRLPTYFPEKGSVFALDPSFEENRANVPGLAHIPINPGNVAILKELQSCNRHGLVVPVDAEHMYDAAVNATGCKLTATGVHYRNLATLNRI